MIEQYQEKYKVSPTHETYIPNTTEELIEILKSFKIDDSKDGNYIITMNDNSVVPINSIVQVPVNKQEKGSEEKKSSFFDKVRSVFKKNIKRI